MTGLFQALPIRDLQAGQRPGKGEMIFFVQSVPKHARSFAGRRESNGCGGPKCSFERDILPRYRASSFTEFKRLFNYDFRHVYVSFKP